MIDDTNKIINEVVSSRHNFTVGSEGSEQSLQKGVNDGVQEIVLSHFQDKDFSNASFTQEPFTKEYVPSGRKVESYNGVINIYTLGNHRVKVWHDWINQYVTLEILDQKERIIEIYRAEWWGSSVEQLRLRREGKAFGRWERFGYAGDETVRTYAYMEFGSKESNNKVRFLEFEDGKLTQSEGINWNEIWFFDCVVGMLGGDMKSSQKGSTITLTRPTNGSSRYIAVDYTNRIELALEYQQNDFANKARPGPTAFITSVGLSNEQPRSNAFYYQGLVLCVGKHRSGGSLLEIEGLARDAKNNAIWNMMSFRTDPKITLSRDGNQVYINRADAGKATFPLQVNLKEFQSSLAEKVLYR